MHSNEMILYRNFKHGEILDDVDYILTERTDDEEDTIDRMDLFAGRLIELAVSHGYSGNIWQAYLTYLIANNENAYSTVVSSRPMNSSLTVSSFPHKSNVLNTLSFSSS